MRRLACASSAPTRELVAKREDLRLQGGTGSKTGGNQSEKGNEKRAHRDRTRISRMIGTSAFSARTEFSVTTGGVGKRLVTAMVTVSSSPSDLLSFPAVPFGRAVTGQRAITFAFPKLIPWLAAKPQLG